MQKVNSCQDELCCQRYLTNTKIPSPAPAPTATAVKPTAAPAVAKPIKPTDDLIKEFPDQFTRIGRFPSEYTI